MLHDYFDYAPVKKDFIKPAYLSKYTEWVSRQLDYIGEDDLLLEQP